MKRSFWSARQFLVASLVAFGPASALAETITQVVPFDYDVNTGIALPVVQGFDTQGGTRQLTGVTFDFVHNLDIELFFESTGPTPVASGDWTLNFGYGMLYQLGEGGKKGEPPPPAFGPGAFFVKDITGAFAAYDGQPGNDGADSFRLQLDDMLTSTQSYGLEEPSVLDALTDVGPLTTVMGGFTELFFAWINDPNWPIPPGGAPSYPDDAAIWVSSPTFRHFGSITITYDYTAVPEPAAVILLSVGALMVVRRR